MKYESLERETKELGVVLVTVALLLVGLLSAGALSVDMGSLFVVRNELQNAADSGALAATRVLYLNDGTQVNAGANQVGKDAAIANNAQGIAVEVVGDMSGNAGDVQRGHWQWSTGTFTPNASLDPVDLWGVSDAELDANMAYINAVRVRVRRQSTPAQSFLSRVMGFNNFPMQAEAVAYIGFAGTLFEAELDQPIAICEESLLDGNGNYNCSTGRMINSNSGGETFNTGGWTNFTQDPCDQASVPTVDDYVGCPPSSYNGELSYGEGMGLTGGELQTIWDDFWDCWTAGADSNGDGRPDTVRSMTLPVISCGGNNNVANCSPLVGAVKVDMVWMIRQTDPNNNWVPLELYDTGGNLMWQCPEGTNADLLTDEQFLSCWQDFTSESSMNLKNYLGTDIGTLPLVDLNKTMFFLPNCDYHPGVGGTGGRNFGILAKTPVLVN